MPRSEDKAAQVPKDAVTKPLAVDKTPASAPRAPIKGDLAPTSPFYSTLHHRKVRASNMTDEEMSRERQREEAESNDQEDGMLSKIDPNPLARRRWERKMLIKDIANRGYVSRELRIKRTERQALAKSEYWRTSMKKLQPLATQIAGKSLEDAIMQMRFSKKKAAKSVLQHLELARDQAVVERGMGLGQAEGTAGSPIVIKLKDGQRHTVKDHTGIYVDQAWVGKGPYGTMTWSRARGRIDLMKLPQTSLSVLLKEEKTRIRQHDERVEKEKRKPVWTQHKDRPLDGQRPYFTW